MARREPAFRSGRTDRRMPITPMAGSYGWATRGDQSRVFARPRPGRQVIPRQCRAARPGLPSCRSCPGSWKRREGYSLRSRTPRPAYPAGLLGLARLDEAQVPPVRVVPIDGDETAMDLARRAVRPRHGHGELREAVAAVALDMRLQDFDRMIVGAGGETLVCNRIGAPRGRGRSRQPATPAPRPRHRATPWRPDPSRRNGRHIGAPARSPPASGPRRFSAAADAGTAGIADQQGQQGEMGGVLHRDLLRRQSRSFPAGAHARRQTDTKRMITRMRFNQAMARRIVAAADERRAARCRIGAGAMLLAAALAPPPARRRRTGRNTGAGPGERIGAGLRPDRA